MKTIDYIIVGQGLAGSILAYTLMHQQQKVVVVDEGKENTSSKVAAGLCNPVVFKRLTKSWMVDELMPVALNFYKHQEELLNDQFYVDIPIYKLFVGEEERDFWQQKRNEPELLEWITHTIEFPFDKNLIDYPFGASHTLQSGFLQTAKWLASFKEYLKNKGVFIENKFDYNTIVFDNNFVCWNGYKAKKIIFCEGYQSINNPYFNWLPFKLTKGEVLTIDFKNLTLKSALNKGVFVLPYNNYYKLGATYDWDNLNEETTEKGKIELLKKASVFIKDDISVFEHKAGIRPTVSDRRPLLGIHPKHEQLAIFNGMGTKGVMIAPNFAKVFTEFLIANKPISKEVDINRFVD
ncbi:MAG: FAD-binding oxidoreductase [Flavobacteriales bacterium]|nr:FAD-binding oxidoreductase [Flavobacteriales bacterium]